MATLWHTKTDDGGCSNCWYKVRNNQMQLLTSISIRQNISSSLATNLLNCKVYGTLTISFGTNFSISVKSVAAFCLNNNNNNKKAFNYSRIFLTIYCNDQVNHIVKTPGRSGEVLDRLSHTHTKITHKLKVRLISYESSPPTHTHTTRTSH